MWFLRDCLAVETNRPLKQRDLVSSCRLTFESVSALMLPFSTQAYFCPYSFLSFSTICAGTVPILLVYLAMKLLLWWSSEISTSIGSLPDWFMKILVDLYWFGLFGPENWLEGMS